MKKTYRIKTNNQEQLQRKQNESDATSISALNLSVGHHSNYVHKELDWK